MHEKGPLGRYFHYMEAGVLSTDLVVVGNQDLAIAGKLPAIVAAAGRAAENAWQDFFAEVELENHNTHRSYNHAVRRFLRWCEYHGKELSRIMPGDVASYLKDDLAGAATTKKVHRSALKRFFDLLVVRHICIINPAASVKTPKVKRGRGTTPMIEGDEITQLIASINALSLAGIRDRAVIAVLAYTACRANGIAHLRRGDYSGRPGRMQLKFLEKGGNQPIIEVRADLEECLDTYLAIARMKTADKQCPLFRPMLRKTQQFRPWLPGTRRKKEQGLLTPNDVCRMVKRRMKAAGLREELSAHSFRVAVLTDLIDQGVAIEDVQELAGHADSRTTKLYDRTQRKATRNLVERIRIKL